MAEQIQRYDYIAVFIGLDVGKTKHQAVALDKGGKRLRYVTHSCTSLTATNLTYSERAQLAGASHTLSA